MHRRTLLVGLTALGLVACGGIPPAHDIKPWVGRPVADLTREWGAPTREMADANQRILIYEEMLETKVHDLSQDTSRKNLGLVPPPSGAPGSSVYARTYLFWVDGSGKITQTQVREP